MSLTDEEAALKFLQLIDTSATAVFAQVTDKLHEWRMYWMA